MIARDVESALRSSRDSQSCGIREGDGRCIFLVFEAEFRPRFKCCTYLTQSVLQSFDCLQKYLV